MGKYAVVVCTLLLFVITLSACVGKPTRERITQRGTETDHCFEGCPEGEVTPPKGYSDLVIKASLKVIKEDPWLFKSVPSREEGASYPVIINVNGQGEQWPMTCKKDRQSRIVNGRRNPEGGEGLKCALERRIRMKPGSYTVYLGLPEERIEKQVGIVLAEGTVDQLDFSPVYFRDTFAGRTFTAGVVDFNTYFNGKPVGPLRR